MNTYNYNDGLCSGGRRPRLYLAKGSEIVKFTGKSIPDFCSIGKESYEKNGKWSNTTYTLNLSAGVRELYFLSPLHGVWGSNFSSWGEVATKLSLPIELVKNIVRTEYPDTAERLDACEKFLEKNDNSAVETVIVSFGSPTAAEAEEGYWSKPKSTKTTDGQTVTVGPENKEDWHNAKIICPVGSRIVSSTHTRGSNGGYWAIVISVPLRAQPHG